MLETNIFCVWIWHVFATPQHSGSSNLITNFNFFADNYFISVSYISPCSNYIYIYIYIYIYALCRSNHIMFKIMLNNYLHCCPVLWFFFTTDYAEGIVFQMIEVRRKVRQIVSCACFEVCRMRKGQNCFLYLRHRSCAKVTRNILNIVSPKWCVPKETKQYPDRKISQILGIFSAKWGDIFSLWKSRC